VIQGLGLFVVFNTWTNFESALVTNSWDLFDATFADSA
jgi:hypothetical protein